MLKRPLSRAITLGAGAVFAVGCSAIAGVSDYSVDPCFDGACDDGASPEGAPPSPEAGADSAMRADASDAATDGDASIPPPSPGLSVVTASGTGVAVGKAAVVTLTAKDDTGTAIPRVGAAVTFTQGGGTSVVSFGAAEDRGDGTYRALATGMTEGTPLQISAIIDGAPLTTAPASLRVVNPPSDGLTFSIDAANADRAGNFGGKGCAASGLGQWTDLTDSSFTGSLNGFDDPCAPLSGWAGTGAPENPYRLSFDGIDDNVAFGAIDALQKYTVLVWMRRTGDGFAAVTSPMNGGGLVGATQVWPILSKGTAEADTDAVDIDYFLGIVKDGQLGSDYESTPGSANQALIGATVLNQNQWYMVGTTLDASVGQRALWVDGAMDASSAPTLPPSGAASSVFTVAGSKRTYDAAGATTCPGAGGANGCGRFKGEIAVVLTYDHALSQTEIEATCHSFSSRFGMLTCPN